MGRPNNNLVTGRIGIDLIKKWESLHDGDLSLIGLQPKMCPAGYWTEGFGHMIIDSKGRSIKGIENKYKAYDYSLAYTEKEAEEILEKDLVDFETIVKNRLTVGVNQNQFDALVSHTYNTGGSNTLFKLVNKSATGKEIWNWFTQHYITVDGKVLNGLIYRREEEAILFQNTRI